MHPSLQMILGSAAYHIDFTVGNLVLPIYRTDMNLLCYTGIITCSSMSISCTGALISL